VGLPLLADAYPPAERFISFQLYQRGTRWRTLQRGAQNRFLKNPRELLDEWTMGFEVRNTIFDQLERELLERLHDPRFRYLDLYITDFDHATHHNRDREAHLYALQSLDAVLGRVWTEIKKSPLASETALIMVSDHGTNTDERIYSQGYNIVKLLGSRAGGGHHVITKRRLMLEYSIKGFYPLVPLVTTTTPDTYYLKGQSTDYPTALLDFDGNERASIHLRDSDLNVLHILLQQLQRKDLTPALRNAMTAGFFKTLDRRRDEWQASLSSLQEELDALRRLIEKQRAFVASKPKKWTPEQQEAGLDQDARREFAHLDSWEADNRKYTEYARTLSNLLALRRESFAPERIKIEDVIAKKAMGSHNSIHALQNYVVGLAAGGAVIAPDGSLDLDKSFTRVDYFALLNNVAVRNNVQAGIESRPVDFVAVRVPSDAIAPALAKHSLSSDEVLWVYDGQQNQALILSKRDEAGTLSLRYLPVANLKQTRDGSFSFERIEWRDRLPLKIWEDARLRVSEDARALWLNDWHTDLEWLRALHETEYSNALVGLHEQLARHPNDAFETDAPGLSRDERLIRRLRRTQRELVEADLLVLANNHWNFDVRGFNPGGNHGSFFRVSTHSTLMMAGGERTRIPQALVVEEPYDSLSFMPTVLALTGQLNEKQTPIQILWERGFRPFPGRIIKEVLSPGGRNESNSVVAEETASAP
jgi:hypothetical protein